MVCLGRPYHFKICKGCHPQISLLPFLNTLTHFRNHPVSTYAKFSEKLTLLTHFLFMSGGKKCLNFWIILYLTSIYLSLSKFVKTTYIICAVSEHVNKKLLKKFLQYTCIVQKSTINCIN